MRNLALAIYEEKLKGDVVLHVCDNEEGNLMIEATVAEIKEHCYPLTQQEVTTFNKSTGPDNRYYVEVSPHTSERR